MNLFQYGLAELATGLRQGTFSARSIMEACAAAHAASEPQLNAYKTWTGERALQVAEHADQLLRLGYDLGLLMGLPVSVKDMYAVPGTPLFAGSARALDESQWQAPGGLVQALLSQLAPVTGKTHTVEFALGGIGTNAHWGTPKNPWDTAVHRVPGGSSSGAGVSLWQGSALLAMGTDTAGSVRIPAALTGTVGLKTTAGRWPTDQIVPLSFTLDTPGILTRSVADAAFAYAAIEGRLGRQQAVPELHDCHGLRIGIPENFFWDGAEDAVVDSVQAAMRTLEQAGAQLVPMQLADCDRLFEVFQQGGLSVAELATFLTSRMPDRLALLDPVVRARIEDGGAISALDYMQRQQLVAEASQRAAQTFGQVDVWLHPTVPALAPAVADLEKLEHYRHYNMLMLRNPAMANLMGLCALSLPAGLAQGLPVGLQLTAAGGQEIQLLAIGQAVERVLGRLQGPNH